MEVADQAVDLQVDMLACPEVDDQVAVEVMVAMEVARLFRLPFSHVIRLSSEMFPQLDQLAQPPLKSGKCSVWQF